MRPLAATLFLGLIAAGGCSSAPDSAREAAYAAVDAARAAQAERYAPDSWHAAQDTLARAASELDAQNARPQLLRRYGRARALFGRAAAAARRAAREAEDVAAARRERLRQQVQRMREQAEAAVAAATLAIDTAPAARPVQPALELLRSDLVELATALQQAQAEYDAGDYQSALTRLEYVARSAGGIPQQVTEAAPPVRSHR